MSLYLLARLLILIKKGVRWAIAIEVRRRQRRRRRRRRR